ncbi:hypothetical protein ACIBG7_12585 [Nonomuraea sp. NPDC050328]|uniref:hypothetical protein n=1 Tax=Nonomuraea sp. NPDC050328 TaxID=3364361 RepID=UPI00379E3AA9
MILALTSGISAQLAAAPAAPPRWSIAFIGFAFFSMLILGRWGQSIGVMAGFEAQRRAAEDPGQKIQGRIQAVNDAFAETARLMSDLDREIRAQQAARLALIAEAEEQKNLLAINTDQAEGIRKIIIGQTDATVRTERRRQWMFFAFGLLVSIPIGIGINLVSDNITASQPPAPPASPAPTSSPARPSASPSR